MRVYPKRNKFYAQFRRRRSVGGKEVRFMRASFDVGVAEAVKLERDIQLNGQLALVMSAEDRVDWVRCRRLCEPFGVTPVHACEEFRDRHQGAHRTFLEVVREIVASKKRNDRVTTYVASLERELLALDKQNPGKRISDYTTADLVRELSRHPDWKPRTKHGAKQKWNVVFAYAVKHGYRRDNPCRLLELPRIVRKEPTKLSIDQMQRGLAACWSSREMLDCLAWFVLGCFAGLRPEELAQLRWEQVSFETETIVIRAATSKCRTRRPVKIQPVLGAWLRPLYREHGLVMPLKLDRTRKLMRHALGFDEWPADICRHTFASYHFYKWHQLDEVRFQMGHSNDKETPETFFNHYCALVVPPDQDVFWELLPPWKDDLDLAAKYLRDLGWRVQMQLRTLALPAPSECQTKT